MSVGLRQIALVAVVVIVVGVLENVVAGSDVPGTAHIVSVGFFFAVVLAALTLIVTGVVALTRRLTNSR